MKLHFSLTEVRSACYHFDYIYSYTQEQQFKLLLVRPLSANDGQSQCSSTQWYFNSVPPHLFQWLFYCKHTTVNHLHQKTIICMSHWYINSSIILMNIYHTHMELLTSNVSSFSNRPGYKCNTSVFALDRGLWGTENVASFKHFISVSEVIFIHVNISLDRSCTL